MEGPHPRRLQSHSNCGPFFIQSGEARTYFSVRPRIARMFKQTVWSMDKMREDACLIYDSLVLKSARDH